MRANSSLDDYGLRLYYRYMRSLINQELFNQEILMEFMQKSTYKSSETTYEVTSSQCDDLTFRIQINSFVKSHEII